MSITQNGNILVVDDNLLNYEVIAMALRKEKYNISYAENGMKAIELTQTNTFDLILLDIMMPELNGYEVCELLKKSPQTSHIPVIFLSALTDTQDKVKAFEEGGVDYITKPISPNELIARVATHIKISNLEKELHGSNKNLEKLVAQSSKDLADNQKEYKLLIENQNDYIIRVNSYNHINFVSPNFYNDSEQDKSQINNASFKEIIYKKDKDNLPLFSEVLLNEPYNINFRARLQTKKGIRWIDWSCKGILTLNNTYDGFIAVGRDVTEQKDSEAKLRITQFAVDHSNMAIAWFFTSGEMNYHNSSFGKLFHLNRDEIIEGFSPELFFNITKDEWFSIIENVRSLNSYHIETMIPGANNKPVHIEIAFNLLTYKKSEYLIAFISNITEKKESEKRIRNEIIGEEEKERKAFIQELHDELEPYLAGIKLFSNQLANDSTPSEKKQLLIKNINEMIDSVIHKNQFLSNKHTPLVLYKAGLSKALYDFIETLNLDSGIDIVINSSDIQNTRFKEELELVIYKTITELINNTILHANASQISIEFNQKGGLLEIIYNDDGIGFDTTIVSSQTTESGLQRLYKRLQTTSANYVLESSSGRGVDFKAIFEIN